jgi:hypothetical protein
VSKGYTYDLSDAEKRDLTRLIQEGRPLPDKYRFILFEDKREVELVWSGKTNEVCTAVLPFQTLEHVDEPREETKHQGELFDGRGRQSQGWTNKLIWGDNKLILSSLKAGALRQQIEDAGGLKLIYIDPPFDVGADFSMDIEIGGETFHKEPNLLEQIAYRDTWGRGTDSFISMIYERLILMRDLLAEDGSIYVHCDWRVNSYLRLALDEVFGRAGYTSEVVWKRTSSHNDPKKYGNIHDTLFYYSRSDRRVWNQQYQPHDPEYLDKVYVNYDERGRYRLADLTAPGISKGDTGIEWRGVNPSSVGRHWRTSPLELERLLQEGRIQLKKDGKPSLNIGVQRELKAADKPFRAFSVLNLGRYERQAYLSVGGRLPREQREAALAAKEREFRELILRAYKGESLEGDGFFHGKRSGRLIAIGPINLPVGRLFVEEVVTEMRKRGATRVDVLAFEFEMGLFPAALEEAKGKGIDLVPRYIPAEVFDKRAVERGQVVFHDVSFVEATPRYAKGRSAREKLTIRIELTEFSVYYTQGALEAAIASLKEGKSDVVCEAGKLVKISKDKGGAVKRETLTKHWTDWVDYWAIDFNYESRKEIIRVPVAAGVGGVLPGFEHGQQEMPLDFEDRWTGGYIFENEWQSFRTRKSRDLELVSADHTYDRPGRYTVAVKVIDIFGNDTMTLVPVNVG